MNTLILEALLIPEIAMEADDITKKVNKILGGKDSPAESVSEDQRDEDLTQTDGLFDDLNEDNATDNPQDNPTNDDSEGESDDNDPSGADELSDSFSDESDPGADEEDMNSESEGDDSVMDDSMDTQDDQEGMKPEDKSIFSDKNTLKKNMIYFFNIIRYTINSLEESLGLCDNQETIRVINSVIQNLYSCKDVLYDILTNKMEKTSYEELVTKYVTIKRIYDISCDMLEEHFNNNPNVKVKYKRFKNKSK